MASLRTLLFCSLALAFCTFVIAADFECYSCAGPVKDGSECGKKQENSTKVETSVKDKKCYYGIHTTTNKDKKEEKTYVRGAMDNVDQLGGVGELEIKTCDKSLCNSEEINGALSSQPFLLATISSILVSLLFCKSF